MALELNKTCIMKQTHQHSLTIRSINHPSNAFSLIELLVVIAVIAILASILVPAVRKVREGAHETKCASNLRQIGVGVGMFVNDHKGYFPALNDGNEPGEQIPWFEQLRPYLKGLGLAVTDPIEVVHCPSAEYYMENDSGTRSNTHGYGWNPNLIPDTRIDSEGNKPSAYRAINVARPGEVILLADAGQRVSSGWAFGYFAFGGSKLYDAGTADNVLSDGYFQVYGASADNPNFSARHGGRGNVLFVDGHIESLEFGQIKEKHVLVEMKLP